MIPCSDPHASYLSCRVEIDGAVVDFCRQHLPSVSDGAFDDPRTEIIIADDGSGIATRDVVRHFEAVSPVPVRHIWHEDDGFRLAEIRNKAIAASRGEYVIQIDGDLILDRSAYALPAHDPAAFDGQPLRLGQQPDTVGHMGGQRRDRLQILCAHRPDKPENASGRQQDAQHPDP